ncbi:MAG: primosomal protein N' [Clostridia bacterium]|nr:primosomal protein N' [Clostridia bacterium]
MEESIAHVHVLEAPFHADREYSYYIPTELWGKIRTGMLVYVPYGAANRKLPALVVRLSGEETAPDKLKPVLSIVSSHVVLSDEQLGLCRFLKERTLCSVGDAVRAIVPSAAISRVSEYYRVNPEEDPTKKLSRLDSKASFLYSFIASRDKSSLSRLKTEFGPECSELLSSLLKTGLIRKETELPTRQNIRKRRMLSLAPALMQSEALEEAIHQQRSQAQAEILRQLERLGESLDTDIYALTGTSASQVSSLLKKGLLTEHFEEEYRNPFEQSPTVRDVGNSPLSPEQKAAHDTLFGLYKSGEPKAALLHGVTGSGKTRVILSMIDHVIGDGRGVIVLVPEIALTPQMVGIFLARYGENVAVIHSSLSAGERYDAWRRIRDGKASVVIGTRSAVFAPLPDVGMIVIDEEQEHTYKSDADPKYSAHDVARFRCGYHKSLMLLASATPSVSSYYKARCGQYTLIEMKNRYGKATLPHVLITDMRGEPGGGTVSPLGSVLRQHLTETTAARRQSIIFLNRRGYNSVMSCRVCGQAITCPNCSVSLTYHSLKVRETGDSIGDYKKLRGENGILTCHYCGFKSHVPTLCPHCGSEHFHFRGYGTQLLEEEIGKMEPAPRVIRMDMDTTQSKFSHEELLTQFREGEADVLLGTQMVTKGHDFPQVTLVGVINADGSLYMDDYRASERTFAMLTQVIGRAGRADKPGIAVIQTFNPTSDIITLAANQDYPEFYRREIRLREQLVFPPFCDIAVITLASRSEEILAAATVRLREWIRDAVSGRYSSLKLVIFGPFEAPVYKVQGVYRNRLVIKCRLNKKEREFLGAILTDFGRGAGKKLTVSADLNPSTL